MLKSVSFTLLRQNCAALLRRFIQAVGLMGIVTVVLHADNHVPPVLAGSAQAMLLPRYRLWGMTML